MIIADLPYLVMISDHDEVKGGEENIYYDSNGYYHNRALAIALAYADGPNTVVSAGTSVYVDRGFSQSRSFSLAQSL